MSTHTAASAIARSKSRFRGFTLIELLVVIAIISALIALLLPSLSKARILANESASASNVKQLLTGYRMYSGDHAGHLMWGYPPATVNGVTVSATAPNGDTVSGVVATRYPWRLVSYVNNVWGVIHDATIMPDTQDPYLLSLSPSYGMNSVYVGGDSGHQGFVGDKPNTGAHVVFRDSDVRRPSGLIVFTDARGQGNLFDADDGHFRATAPHAAGHWWHAVNHKPTPKVSAAISFGMPRGWYSDRVVTGFHDSHVELMIADDLQDMRLWANKANAIDYDYAP